MANIVLAHGILGFDKIGLAGFTIANYFNGVSDALERENHKVFAPDVSAVATVASRAVELEEKIVEFCREKNIPEKSLHIIAHSMGGLDARLALANKNGRLAKYTKSLVTLGAPHTGSPIADLLAEDLLFTKLLYGNVLNIFGDSVGGLDDLTQGRGEEFNRNTKSISGVRYFSISGTNTKPEASVFFESLGALIKKANDGVVPFSSARKSDDGWVYKGQWPVDHAGLVGLILVNAITMHTSHDMLLWLSI